MHIYTIIVVIHFLVQNLCSPPVDCAYPFMYPEIDRFVNKFVRIGYSHQRPSSCLTRTSSYSQVPEIHLWLPKQAF